MNNVAEYVRKLLLAYDNDLDLRNGAPLNDLLVNAGSAIITSLKLQQDQLFQYLTLEEPESLNEETLDTFAKSYLVDRRVGSKASGYVKVYVSDPRLVNIPKSTQFKNQAGLVYKTTRDYSFTEADVRANNALFPYYATGDIYIEAEEAGIQYNTAAGQITQLVSTLAFEPAFINNPTAIENSTIHEDNSALYTKILNSALNKTLYTSAGIQTVLVDQFPTIQDVVVVGTDEAKMTRDLAYISAVSGIKHNLLYERSDYFGAFGPIASGYLYSGILNGAYTHFSPFNESSAYANGVTYSGVTMTSGNLPLTSSFAGKEFTIEQYAGLYKNDTNYSQIETRIILEENFDHSILSEIGWTASDATAGVGSLRYYQEVETEDGFARLGYKPAAEAVEGIPIIVDSTFLTQISGLIDRALQL